MASVGMIDIVRKLIPERFRPQSLAVAELERKMQNGRVIAGPFAGMRLLGGGSGSATYPKFLGTYELELRPTIERLCSMPFKLIINVGAAEGYYAVGCALRCADARIIAFETDNANRALMLEHARLNSVVDRIEIYGFCQQDNLRNALTSGFLSEPSACLILMDVEGAEEELLKPQSIPELRQTHILVELHDCYSPGLDSEIMSRFESTHHMDRVQARRRTIGDLPFHILFLDRWLLRLTEEFRPSGMSWLCMSPKSNRCDT